ncbi:mitochondrial inner membrane protease subunit 2 [Caerostris darwini]|uniref:Mitochondrial inner membrane protease subunit 2 n=1 Tax=Caerostris darwini TaxID=1538125 RepID=A0AAV4RX27_9ARAC|nr:mitochondrial inner membrane protease subunit 2 [Caerostris darwini]
MEMEHYENLAVMSGTSSRWGVWLRRLGKNFLISVPVTVVFLDSVGYVAKVEGISMQPSLNPDEQKTNDYVLLNKWAIRNYEVRHGDVVALT